MCLQRTGKGFTEPGACYLKWQVKQRELRSPKDCNAVTNERYADFVLSFFAGWVLEVLPISLAEAVQFCCTTVCKLAI